MNSFLITYDNTPPRDYRRLVDLMIKWRATRLAKSVWLVNLPAIAAQVRDAVQTTLQPNDPIAVVQLVRGADWAVNGAVDAGAAAWLSVNVQMAERAA
ncbi:MAG: hypothetical protein ACK4PC_08925 [Sphingopyxis sp.]